MTEIVVRVIRTWDVPVAAVYGDTDETLTERARAAVTDGLAADAETAVVLPTETTEEVK